MSLHRPWKSVALSLFVRHYTSHSSHPSPSPSHSRHFGGHYISLCSFSGDFLNQVYILKSFMYLWYEGFISPPLRIELNPQDVGISSPPAHPPGPKQTQTHHTRIQRDFITWHVWASHFTWVKAGVWAGVFTLVLCTCIHLAHLPCIFLMH